MTPAQSFLEYACQQVALAVRCNVMSATPSDIITQRIVALAKECGVILNTTEGDDAGSH